MKPNASSEFAQELLKASGGGGQPAVPMASASSLRVYHPDNTGFIKARWGAALDDFNHRAQNSLAMDGDPVQAIKALGMAYARFATENPDRFSELFNLDTGHLATEINDNPSQASAYRLALQLGMDAVEQKGLRVSDPEMVIQVLWAAIHGVFSLINTWPDFPFRDPALLVSAMMDYLEAGILASTSMNVEP